MREPNTTILSVEQHPNFRAKPPSSENTFFYDFLQCIKGNDDAMLMNHMHDQKKSQKTGLSGVECWQEFSQQPHYYIPKNETALIIKTAQHIIDLIGSKLSFIDLGAGPLESIKTKVHPLLTHSTATEAYIPIDLCKKYVLDAQTYIAKSFPHICVEGMTHNFYQCKNIGNFYKNPVGLIFGNTIGNIAEAKTVRPYNLLKSLKALKSTLGASGHLLITQDTCRDPKILFDAYHNQACKNLCMNILYRAAEEFEVIGFNPDSFKYELEWKKELNYIGGKAIAQKTQIIVLSSRLYKINKGHEISLFRSYKYPADTFVQMGIEAGFTPIKTFMCDDNRIALHVWKT